jgi:hypothetical protein
MGLLPQLQVQELLQQRQLLLVIMINQDHLLQVQVQLLELLILQEGL